MANYPAWYGKKRERLIQRLREFDVLLQNQPDPSELAEGAELVRAAKIRALKSRRAQLPPSERSASAIAKFDAEIQLWDRSTAEEVIQRCRDGTVRRASGAVQPPFR